MHIDDIVANFADVFKRLEKLEQRVKDLTPKDDKKPSKAKE